MYTSSEIGLTLVGYLVVLGVTTIVLLNDKRIDGRSQGLRIAILWLIPLIGPGIIAVDFIFRWVESIVSRKASREV